MKKIYLTFLIVLLLFQIFIDKSQIIVEEQVIAIEEEQVSTNHYYISFEKENCTTLNLKEYFNSSDIEIKTIYPKNQLVIDDEKINQQLFSFLFDDEKKLQEKYLTILNKYGLDEDIEKVSQHGIAISKVEIITDYSTLKTLLNKFPNLQYSYQLKGYYQ